MVTSEKFLGSRMKYDNSETDYTKVGNEFFNSFILELKKLCKHLPIIFAQSSTTFHSFYNSLIRSRILNLEYLTLMYGCAWFPPQMSHIAFILIYTLSESLSVYDSSIETEMDSYYSELCSLFTKSPSSNIAKVIILRVCS